MAQGAYEKLTPIRLVFVVIAMLIMVFSGGCTLIFLIMFAMESGSNRYVNVPVILIFGAPPFLVGLLVWWLAARAGRKRIS
jgi:hypothetical protein